MQEGGRLDVAGGTVLGLPLGLRSRPRCMLALSCSELRGPIIIMSMYVMRCADPEHEDVGTLQRSGPAGLALALVSQPCELSRLFPRPPSISISLLGQS